MPWLPPYTRRALDPVKAADVIVYKDGERAIAVKRNGERIAASTDHAAVIQAAIDSLPVLPSPWGAKAGTVYIAAGYYEFSYSVMVPRFVNIIGAGRHATVINSPSDYAFRLESTGLVAGFQHIANMKIDGLGVYIKYRYNIEVSGIQFDGRNTYDRPLYLYAVEVAHLHDLFFSSPVVGIGIDFGGWVIVEKVHMDTPNNHGIKTFDAHDLVIKDVNIDAPGHNTSLEKVNETATGIWIDGSSQSSSYGHVIINARISGPALHGIAVTIARHVRIIGSQLRDWYRVLNEYPDGNGIYLRSVQDAIVIANSIRNYPNGYGIIEDNDPRTEEVSDNNIIAYNSLTNTMGISKVGANTIVRLNKGYPTENSGRSLFSGDAATTQFVIPHGLVAAPSRVKVTPCSVDAAGQFYVTVDDANIYVNYLSAPPAGTDNVCLYWEAEV